MAELSGVSIDAARQREDTLVARNQTAASTDVELENVLHAAHQTQAQLGQRLDRIERALDEGVSRAGSLKTPAAKRAFQQFLLAKHQEIVQVLEDGKQSAADLASQMTGVGGQYQPASGDGAGGEPGGSDAAIRAASFGPPLKTDGGAPGTSEDDGDGIGMSSLFVDTTQHGNGHYVPPSPPDAAPPAAGAPPPPAASGGSQGIGMSSLFADTTQHDPAPPAPITTAEDSQRASGGDLNGSMGMWP